MMTPSQINTQRFNTVAKGGYRTVEVDAFLQKIYQNYSRLYSDNNELHERAENMASLVAEYEKSKSAIAQALIWAQSKADESIEESKKLASSIVAEASQQAENMLIVKKAEAEAYYAERTQVAEDRLKAAEENFDKVKADAESFAEKYINDVNNKAKAIIAQTNKQLDEYKKEIAALKNELQLFVVCAQQATEKITIDAELELNRTNQVNEAEFNVEEPEVIDFTYSNELLDNIGSIEKSNDAETLSKFANDEKQYSPLANAVLDEIEENLPPMDLISEQDGTKEYKPKAAEKEDISDVNSYISKIFDSVETEKKEKAAKFSIDYKTDLDDLISEVLDGSVYSSQGNTEENTDDNSENLDEFFDGEE